MSRIALSLRQPWAWAVVHAGKRIENRRWNTKFRGEFLIHASKGCTHDEYVGAAHWLIDTSPGIVVPILQVISRGGIVGKARLVDVIPPCGEASLFAKCSCRGAPWHMPEQFGFVLENIEPLPFEPCTGKLGFFDPDVKDWKRPAFGGDHG